MFDEQSKESDKTNRKTEQAKPDNAVPIDGLANSVGNSKPTAISEALVSQDSGEAGQAQDAKGVTDLGKMFDEQSKESDKTNRKTEQVKPDNAVPNDGLANSAGNSKPTATSEAFVSRDSGEAGQAQDAKGVTDLGKMFDEQSKESDKTNRKTE